MKPKAHRLVFLACLIIGVLHVSAAYANTIRADDLLGKWFHWRTFDGTGEPALVLKSDGSGLRGGRQIRWSVDESSLLVTITDSGTVSLWHYVPKEKALFFDETEENLARIKRGEVVRESPVYIREDSSMRRF
jgi:hypothetical protein